jgi:murein L,D-transpeptidase YafK
VSVPAGPARLSTRTARIVLALAVGLTAAPVVLPAVSGHADAQSFRSDKARVSRETLALMDDKGMARDAPILVRIYKMESELEVWKETRAGTFALLKTYPICRWSGDLGPKTREGDRQAPEGFYRVGPSQMNPNSEYFLSFNLGYPNAFDRSFSRTGSALMVHGDCLSRGCYAMTDEQMAEVYGLAQEALSAGQDAFQAQVFPFRMTPENMARHRNHQHIAFWRMLKEGADHFEVSRREVKVNVCERRYVYNAHPPGHAGGGGTSTGARLPATDPWGGVTSTRTPTTTVRPASTAPTISPRPQTGPAPGSLVTPSQPGTAPVPPARGVPAAVTVTPAPTEPPPPPQLVFDPTGKCPDFEVPADIARAVAARQRNDQQKIAALSSPLAPSAPGKLGRDGSMHPVFLSQLIPEGTTDDFGRLIPRPKAPGTVPNHVNPPIDRNDIVAALGLGGEPDKPIAGRIPVPKPDPRGPGVRVAAARAAATAEAAAASPAVPGTVAAPAPASGDNMLTRMMAPVASTFTAATSWMSGAPRSDAAPAAPASAAVPAPTRTPQPRPATRPAATPRP